MTPELRSLLLVSTCATPKSRQHAAHACSQGRLFRSLQHLLLWSSLPPFGLAAYVATDDVFGVAAPFSLGEAGRACRISCSVQHRSADAAIQIYAPGSA